MEQLIQTLIDSVEQGSPVAYTALVETRGSTPQKAGAVMLVFPDGSQTGTLGGGCVEAEVKRRALQSLDIGEAEVLTFSLDHDYGWDDGLICGGRMTMLVDPVRTVEDLPYFQELLAVCRQGQAATEAVLFDPLKLSDSTEADAATNPPIAGDRWLFDQFGKLHASRRDSQPPAEAVTHLRDVGTRPRPYQLHGLSYLPRLERCRLLIVGAGHVGQQVAALAHQADFDVWVVDDREQYCNAERFPQAKRRIVADIDNGLSGLDVDSDTYCIIVTRGHNHDEEALYHLAETPARYVGLIGSHRKIKMIFADLLAEGISREALTRVHAPLGYDIGSQTVPEIAISIVAELIAHRNLGTIPAPSQRKSLMTEVD